MMRAQLISFDLYAKFVCNFLAEFTADALVNLLYIFIKKVWHDDSIFIKKKNIKIKTWQDTLFVHENKFYEQVFKKCQKHVFVYKNVYQNDRKGSFIYATSVMLYILRPREYMSKLWNNITTLQYC